MQVGNFSKAYIKSCLSEFVTGVTVVTTVGRDGVRCGITVNSFNSVSLVPPMVLFSIERSASRFEVFNSCSKFVVNILTDKQKGISQGFAECNMKDWEDFSCNVIEGIPIIDGAMSYIYCVKKHVYDGGDHKIIVGQVIDCSKLNNDGSPLIYYRGKYMMIGGLL
ncbi:MAG: flavin reductase family protein [Ehrlichia sp.]